MKFLVTFRRRDGVPIPPDAIAGMLLAQRDWLHDRLAEGSFDCAYTFAQSGGGIGIVEASSEEELTDLLTDAPLFGVAHIELQPLASIETLAKAARALRSTAAASPA
jgi:muconolactone delta-isomerase